jgi:hypothetical protein
MGIKAGGFRSRAGPAEAVQKIAAEFQIRQIELTSCGAVSPGSDVEESPLGVGREPS